MATMLGFIVCDVNITKNLLHEALTESVDRTFNMITVDGDTSTNDMVAIMCSGKAEHPQIRKKGRHYQAFRRALDEICEQLARLIVSDGEGATKFVEYVVEGARDDESARKIARTITDSSLVKTAIFGHDPNWGRIMGAAGRAGVDFDPDKVDLSISAGETVPILKDGQPVKLPEGEPRSPRGLGARRELGNRPVLRVCADQRGVYDLIEREIPHAGG